MCQPFARIDLLEIVGAANRVVLPPGVFGSECDMVNIHGK
jgi:hypothetical protein